MEMSQVGRPIRIGDIGEIAVMMRMGEMVDMGEIGGGH
jgi:hypothetical protein